MENVSLKSLERDIMDMLMHVAPLQDHGKQTCVIPGQPFASMVHASHAIMHLGIASCQVAVHQGERACESCKKHIRSRM